MAAPNADMAQFFDFGEAAVPNLYQEQDQEVPIAQSSQR